MFSWKFKTFVKAWRIFRKSCWFANFVFIPTRTQVPQSLSPAFYFTIGFIINHMAMARNKFMITWLEAIMSINNNSTQDKTHTVTRFSLLIPKFKHFFIAWESFVCLPLTFSRVAWLNVGKGWHVSIPGH